MIIKESIINFKINDIVVFRDRKGRVDKIVGNEILVWFGNEYKVLHYSVVNILNHSRIPNTYKKWSKYEEEVLRSGKTPKQLSRELGRNIQNIYNKMRMLNIPRKK